MESLELHGNGNGAAGYKLAIEAPNYERSPSISKLAAALVKFQSEVAAIKKDADNPFFKSKYAPLENIIAAIREPLKHAGLAVSQWPVGEDHLMTILMHESGEFLTATAKMSPKDHTPQGQGSAITYMRRYSLGAVLNLATEEDDDGNQATHGKQQPPERHGHPVPQKDKPAPTPQQYAQTATHALLWKTLVDYFKGDEENAAALLFNLTTYTSKSGARVQGLRDVKLISEKVAEYALGKFEKEYANGGAK